MKSIKITRRGHSIFIPLPREAWQPIEGGCKCRYCEGLVAYWDTLAVDAKRTTGIDFATYVHAPELHDPAKVSP